MKDKNLVQLTVRIDKKDKRDIEELVEKEIYFSVSHAVRRGVKLVLKEHGEEILA